jgi:hypothetical protein
MSMDTISNAVPASSPSLSTTLEIRDGLASTSLWSSAMPMAATMPWPTRAITVSSVAPPTSRSRLVRTVTRARVRSWMPFFDTPSMVAWPRAGFGQSMTLGLTLVRTASRTSRPARSMAAARSKVRLMRAREAATSAVTTARTLPRARTWACSLSMSTGMPALVAITSVSMITLDDTRRRYMPTKSISRTWQPEESAWSHSFPKAKMNTAIATRTTTAMNARI